MSGRKVFTAGEVLQAADVNDYLMDQSVMVFAGTAARGSAIPSPTEGMVTYLEDSDVWEGYTTSWAPIGGKILQVVSTTKTDTFSASVATNDFSSAVTGLTASITPSSTSSKIYVSVSISGAGLTGGYCSYVLDRSGTAIGAGVSAGNRVGISAKSGLFGDTNGVATTAFNFLDSPNSTSSLTYGVKLHNQASTTSTLYVNRTEGDLDSRLGARPASTITLMEVAG